MDTNRTLHLTTTQYIFFSPWSKRRYQIIEIKIKIKQKQFILSRLYHIPQCQVACKCLEHGSQSWERLSHQNTEGLFYGEDSICTELQGILGFCYMETLTCKTYLDNTEQNNSEKNRTPGGNSRIQNQKVIQESGSFYVSK